MSEKKVGGSFKFGCGSVVMLLVILVVVILGLYRCTFRVPKGCAAVLMSETSKTGDGLQEKPLREGMYFYNPLITDYFIEHPQFKNPVLVVPVSHGCHAENQYR